MKKINLKRKYDWRPDVPDQRDFSFSLKIAAPVSVPPQVDIRNECSEVEDQGPMGSCTGQALAGLMEFLQLKEIQKDTPDPEEIYADGTFADVSRLFIYYNARLLRDSAHEDSGASMRDAIKGLAEWGACSEALWAYSRKNLFAKPNKKSYLEAKQHLISSYFRLTHLNELKQCLALEFPFVFGFAVYESFETIQVARTGIMPMPKIGERMLGGHAVMAVGYDDTKKMVIVRNSWGKDWGDHGYFWMPYDYIENAHLALDFWTIRK